jgi:threonine synthase
VTADGLLFRCPGCGAETTPSRAEPLPFRCPRAATGVGVDHVLARVRSPRTTFSPGPEDDPFLRYRALSAAHALATREGMSDAAYVARVASVERAIAAIDGGGFRVTKTHRAEALERAIGAPGLELWVKDETGDVSGSHKARHLMGILLYLEVAREVGLLAGEPPRLAIASCGNAALAAAVVARAGGLPLEVFIPPDANARVVERLRALGAAITVCPRTPASPPGDPCVHAFRDAIARGSLPFCCQGSDNGLTIDGGETLGYELAEAAPALDAIFVQVGGGALASSIAQGLRVARGSLPRVYAVQTHGAAPLARAHVRVATRAAASGSIEEALAYAARHRADFMWPWEETPRSVAHGILDDETYDWLAIVRAMLESGGGPVVVDEATLARANELARAATGIAVDPTGSSGLAGLLHVAATSRIEGRVAVVFSGRDRDSDA